MAGVFAGGDVTSGPSTVIQAVAAGRGAAEAIDRSLAGRQKAESEKDSGLSQALLKFNPSCLHKALRMTLKKRPASERSLSEEDHFGFNQNEMETEADRCFNCGCVAVNPSDIAPTLVALDAKITTNKRMVEAEAFFAARPLKSTILDEDELVTEIRIPGPKPGTEPGYSKFSIRKSIDFPIVGVATVIRVNSGKIRYARIVLGAVAPVPMRIRGVEEYLKGKEISENLADEAANMAISGAITLEKNEYKLQIAKALIKRAILAAKR